MHSRNLITSSLRTVFPYLLFGALWIWGSDHALLFFSRDPETISILSTYKGFAFMVVTTILLFFLVLRKLRQYESLQMKLDARQQEYDEFLFATSHHLRTPLVTIGGFANEISSTAQQNPSRITDDLIEYSGRIQHGVRQMEGILKSMSRLHRNLRDTPAPETIETAKVIHALFLQLQSTTPPDQLSQIHIGELPKVFADPNHIRILFLELLGNALQHRRKDTQLDIYVSGYIRRRRATILIRDNGPGFQINSTEQLFQPIMRKESIQDLGNLRMGLAIALRCARWNGGDLSIHSELDKGTLITLNIPCARN